MQSSKRCEWAVIVTFRPKHPKWDQTLQFTPLSKRTSIPVFFVWVTPGPNPPWISRATFFLDVTLGFILSISHRSPSYFSLTRSNFSIYLLNSKNRICLLSKTARKPKKHSRNCGRQLSKRKIECKNSVTVNLVFIVFLDPFHAINVFSKVLSSKTHRSIRVHSD